MSIAGIAKEVATITISAWFFGDELTPLNITGVAITTCGGLSTSSCQAHSIYTLRTGIVLFTYHKYRKSIDSKVSLDAHGNPIEDEFEDNGDSHHLQDLADEERQPLAAAAEDRSAEPDVRWIFDTSYAFSVNNAFLSRRKGPSPRNR